ncbi:protein-disulfide reductase DsbD family protein [Porphyromonas pogonae]|uniref:protein-disulfide reductase DsbD family protein n=1 Tax=Porphyromonas pogonae TaxID=867595 RepID=UPI002E785FBF|nr:cytochrome c biogenesis protein CcdA [Porphyromonas pogonae]
MIKPFSRRAYVILLFLLACSLFGAPKLSAQIVGDIATWSKKLNDEGKPEKTLLFSAQIKSGWHVYHTDIPAGGPSATEFTFDKIEGAKLIGKPQADKKPDEVFDKNFNMKLRWFHGSVTFSQKIQVTDPAKFKIEGNIRYMGCNDENCVPPTRWEFSFGPSDLTSKAAAPASATEENAATEAPLTDSATVGSADSANKSATVASLASTDDLWQPVITELRGYGDTTLAQTSSSLWKIFIYGFLGGLVALLTPCVWPMIPMTVSFFLKRTSNRRKAIRDAVNYGLSIIVIYLILGLLITAIFGANALNSLATNAVFNIIFFLLLVFFAISFFGAFELVLPASWTAKMDERADKTTGLLSIFFMAFTLVLVSFSCTGPIIGTLLVEAATMGSYLGPAIGMFGFAAALALPFSLFAIFPNWLQSMPKSGGWLNTVKVVLAFLELALAFKFLSVADLAYRWHILDRETFIAIWIVIFALLGIYLLGKIRFSHDSPVEHVSVKRLFMAIISLSFAMYMVPGLWGAPLKAISAFAPPLHTQDFNLYEGAVHPAFDDYEEGMAYARKQNKPVLIDFSGAGCVNCRKMENSVWINEEVKKMLDNDFVIITLLVDDRKPLPQVMEVQENGKTLKLREVGEKWSYFQRSKFGASTQPFYVMLDHQGKPLGPSRSYNEDIPAYIKFLKGGLDEFKTRSK